MERRQERPIARASGLVVKALPDEVLIYHLARHRAHSLNRVAAAVWRRCDGTHTLGQIAASVRGVDALPVSEEIVRYAIGQLGRAGLLLGPVVAAGLSRRELIRRLGAAASVALPLVTSIAAPTAAQAQSVVCVEDGASCDLDLECCAGACAPPAVCFCSDQDKECFVSQP